MIFYFKCIIVSVCFIIKHGISNYVERFQLPRSLVLPQLQKLLLIILSHTYLIEFNLPKEAVATIVQLLFLTVKVFYIKLYLPCSNMLYIFKYLRFRSNFLTLFIYCSRLKKSYFFILWRDLKKFTWLCSQ